MEIKELQKRRIVDAVINKCCFVALVVFAGSTVANSINTDASGAGISSYQQLSLTSISKAFEAEIMLIDGGIKQIEIAQQRHEAGVRLAIEEGRSLPVGLVTNVAPSKEWIRQYEHIGAPSINEHLMNSMAKNYPRIFKTASGINEIPMVIRVSSNGWSSDANEIFSKEYRYDPLYGEAWNKAAREHNISPAAIYAISLQESGMRHEDRMFKPWPWTLNCNTPCPYGSMRFKNERDARISLKSLLKAGWTNIDVGMMQVNYHYHAKRFPGRDLLNLYDNIWVGGRIFKESFEQSGGDLKKAFALYHVGVIKESNRSRANHYSSRVIVYGAAAKKAKNRSS